MPGPLAGGGARGRRLPWGEEPPDEEHANFERQTGRISPVGLFPRGATPEGVLDMGGTVWEWTARFDDRRHTFSLRGGADYLNVRDMRPTDRLYLKMSEEYYFEIRFRCLCE